MGRVLVPVLATLVLIIVGAVATLGFTYWVMARRFLAGDAHALEPSPFRRWMYIAPRRQVRGPVTKAGIFGPPAKVAIVAFALLVAPMVDFVAAQDRPGLAAELAAGWVGFADDGIVSESLVGGAARWYLLPRISVGPELIYIFGASHSHLMVTGNVTWDVLAPTNRPHRVTPFLVAGGGVFQTREDLFNGTYTSSEGAFTAGGGVRALVGDRLTLGLEMRVGWEPHIRFNGVVGLQLGR